MMIDSPAQLDFGSNRGCNYCTHLLKSYFGNDLSDNFYNLFVHFHFDTNPVRNFCKMVAQLNLGKNPSDNLYNLFVHFDFDIYPANK